MSMILVTEKHIEAGVRAHFMKCPVALAINEILNKKYIADVGLHYISILEQQPMKEKTSFKLVHEILIDFKTARCISEFDAFGTVKPFSFEVEIPKKFLDKTKNH